MQRSVVMTAGMLPNLGIPRKMARRWTRSIQSSHPAHPPCICPPTVEAAGGEDVIATPPYHQSLLRCRRRGCQHPSWCINCLPPSSAAFLSLYLALSPPASWVTPDSQLVRSAHPLPSLQSCFVLEEPWARPSIYKPSVQATVVVPLLRTPYRQNESSHLTRSPRGNGLGCQRPSGR